MMMTRRNLLAAAPGALATSALTVEAVAATTGRDVLGLTAVDLAAAIRRRDVSAREVMTAHLARVDALNPRFNAIVSRVDGDLLLREAAAQDEDAAKGRFRGPLHGFPHAVKDTAPAK